jgi:hypothetical protein
MDDQNTMTAVNHPNSLNLSLAIRKVRSSYIEKGISPSYYKINCGLCEDFALDVIKLMGGYTDTLSEVYTESFLTADERGWDWERLRDTWGVVVPKGFRKDEFDKISFGGHAWIVCEGKFFDAECPDGVESFFDLPIFKRPQIARLRNKGISEPDVETDDVLPPPPCPIAMPTNTPSLG